MAKEKQVPLPRVVRVDEDVHERLKIMAERDHRTITNLIGVLILEAVHRDKREHPDG